MKMLQIYKLNIENHLYKLGYEWIDLYTNLYECRMNYYIWKKFDQSDLYLVAQTNAVCSLKVYCVLNIVIRDKKLIIHEVQVVFAS